MKHETAHIAILLVGLACAGIAGCRRPVEPLGTRPLSTAEPTSASNPGLHADSAREPRTQPGGLANDQELLRARLKAILGDDFVMVSDHLDDCSTDEGYWVVTLEAKKSSSFVIRHRFEHEPNWGYPQNSHEYAISVGNQGTPRRHGVPSFSILPMLNRGDSVIIPFFFSKHVTSHDFDRRTEYQGRLDDMDRALEHQLARPESTRALDPRISNRADEAGQMPGTGAQS